MTDTVSPSDHRAIVAPGVIVKILNAWACQPERRRVHPRGRWMTPSPPDTPPIPIASGSASAPTGSYGLFPSERL